MLTNKYCYNININQRVQNNAHAEHICIPIITQYEGTQKGCCSCVTRRQQNHNNMNQKGRCDIFPIIYR